MQIPYYGHSCFLIETDDKKILFDPFITPNEFAQHINLNQPEADKLSLSHGHQDHMTDIESIYENTKASLLAKFELLNCFGSNGDKGGRLMNSGWLPGESYSGNATYELDKLLSRQEFGFAFMPIGDYFTMNTGDA